jgi:hypothetical protein
MKPLPRPGRDSGGTADNPGGLYVQITSNSETKIGDVNAIVMERWLQDNFSGYSDCRRSRDGNLVLLTKTKQQAEISTSITEIQTGPEKRIPVSVKLMANLNTCKGTIFGSDLLKIPLEGPDGLLEYLSANGVANIERLKTRSKNGNLEEMGLHVLTFNNRRHPTEVKVGYLNYSVKTWYPSPLKCQHCLEFGHTKNRCGKQIIRCKKCSNEIHDGDCSSKCFHCDPPKDHHSAFSRDCPVMKHEVDICRLKVDQNISFKAAREQLAPQRGRNYAEAVKSGLPDTNAIFYESEKLQNQIDEYEAAIADMEKKKNILAKLKLHYEKLSQEVDVLNKEVSQLKSKTPMKPTASWSQQSMSRNLNYNESGPIASRLRNSIESSQSKPATPPVAKKRQKTATPPTAEECEISIDNDLPSTDEDNIMDNEMSQITGWNDELEASDDAMGFSNI